MYNAKIISVASYLPKKIYDNDYMASIVDTSDEWIVERTGIKQRHIAADDELTSDLAYKAAVQAIANAGIEANFIDMIVLATTTPDYTFPSTASILQHKLSIDSHCFAFDLQAVCGGFVYALEVATNAIKVGQAKRVLVVGAETLSRIVDWSDRNTCVLFGDGAGAVILEATTEKCGVLATSLHSDGSYFEILHTSGGVSVNQESGKIQMLGKEVFKVAVTKMADCVLESLNKLNKSVEDIDWLIPHQANQRILLAVANRLGLMEEKVISTVALHANTSAASIPLALDYAVQQNKLKKGDLIVLEALGGGLTWGSVIVEW